MRYFVLSFTLLFLINCASSRNTADRLIRSEGVKIAGVHQATFTDTQHQGVAKVMIGGSFSSTGTFISDNGLLLAGYRAVIPYLASVSSGEDLKFAGGFSAVSREEEIPLDGITLLILTEQTEVTDQVRAGLSENSRNYQIFQTIEKSKRELIEARAAEEPDILVEISDIYSGNRHIMSVYKMVDDVRLVAAPEVQITRENISASAALLDIAESEFSLLRAYDRQGNPFKPAFYFEGAHDRISPSDSLFAIGYPGSTYRLDTKRTTNFYFENTNPYVLEAYRIYRNKEDSLSALSPDHAIQSLASRLETEEQIRYYETIQRVIPEDSVLILKQREELALNNWIFADSLRAVNYGRVLSSVEQAIDIASQSGDIYFASNYFSNLSLLDDLNNQFRAYLRQSDSLQTDREKEALKSRLLQIQNQFLQQIDVGAEMNMLGDFIYIIQSVPEEQRPLAMYDIFYGLGDSSKRTIINRFIDEQVQTSFLFSPEKTIRVLEDDRFYNDPLFVILDEIATTLEFARSNYLRHLPYLVPAQMLLTEARLLKEPDLAPDARNILSHNFGSLIREATREDRSLFYASIDFTGKAPGTPILNSDHKIVGVTTAEITESVSANYYYQPENAFLKVRPIDDILDDLLRNSPGENILNEINP